MGLGSLVHTWTHLIGMLRFPSANHEEEQSMEVEALEAIYAEAFSVTNGSPLEWKVHLEPTEGGSGEASHGEQSSIVYIEISMLNVPVQYPGGYI